MSVHELARDYSNGGARGDSDGLVTPVPQHSRDCRKDFLIDTSVLRDRQDDNLQKRSEGSSG